MLPLSWGLLGVALLIAFTKGISITSAIDDETNEAERSKRSYKRGQTQSQYLNFGQPELDGKAEAEATESGSRSTVSGTHGMGQAQSQFSSGDCSGCGAGSPVYEYSTGSPDPLTLGANGISYSDGKPSSIIGAFGGTGYPSATGGQVGRPESAGSFLPGQLGESGFGPVTTVTGGHSYAPGTSDLGQNKRPGADGTYTPSGAYAPGGGGAGQIGKPGTDDRYAPGHTGQIRRPGAASDYTPGSAYTPGISGVEQGGRPVASGDTAQGGQYVPASGGAGQAGRPGAGNRFAPGSQYIPGSDVPGQAGRPGADGSYRPGSTGQIVRPGASDSYGPGSQGQIGRPGPGGAFAPDSTYTSGGGEASQAGRPIAGGAYPPGSTYPPGGATGAAGAYRPGSTGQIGGPTAGVMYSPNSANVPSAASTEPIGRPGAGSASISGSPYISGSDGARQLAGPGSSGVYTPSSSGTAQIGPQGSSFGSSFSPGASIEKHGAAVQPPGISFSPQAPGYGQSPGQQIPGYIPGTSYNVPGAGKQQVPQYIAAGQKLPTYGTDGRRPVGQPGQQAPSYGQQIPRTQITQPGSFHRPSSGLASGQQQNPQRGTEQQTGYAPGYGVPTAGGAEMQAGIAAQPGAQYPGPQQILQQPGLGTTTGLGIQPNGGTVQAGSGFTPSSVVGQQGRAPSSGGVVQPGVGFVQPGFGYGPQGGIQNLGGLVNPSGSAPGTGNQHGNFQSGTDNVPTGLQLPGGFRQPSAGGQPLGGYVQPGNGILPGTNYGQSGTALQQGSGILHGQGLLPQQNGLHPGTGFEQRGTGYQPTHSTFGSQGGKPETVMQQGLSGEQQAPGYTPGLGPQTAVILPTTGSGYQQEATYARPIQSGMHPSGGFAHPLSGQSQLGQPGTGVPLATGFGQQISGQARPGQQRGAGFAQYPAAGMHQPGAGFIPMPIGGVQQDPILQQGSGLGTAYDTNHNQQPTGQRGDSYGQPTGTSQYQPESGVTGSQFPIAGPHAGYGQPSYTAVTQPGQGPQHITQPGFTSIPGGMQPSGTQQNTAGSGGLTVGVSGPDDAFSQAESSIGNGQAAASAQGKKNGGTAKTQVQGTYSSSGSFSASAMTSDNDRSASSQVTGGVEGAMSQSQGQGGAAQSQAQVQINEKTGGTKASSQSGGIIHQSQSEVQANDKGGLADAQSSGPGQTSSQAQIGFRPGQDGEIVRSTGGGQASAQSGVHSGNSQSQIQGTSKYGVSYHGAAQSASGTKEQVATYREQNRDLFNTISQFGNANAVTDRVDTIYNPSLTSESDIPDLQLKASKTNKEVINSNKLDDDSVITDEEEEEEPYDEYEDEEDYYNENPIKMDSKANGDKKLTPSSLYRTHTQTSPTQTQQAAVSDPSKKYNLVQNQNGRVQKFPARTTTETVPNGFRGTVNVEKKFHTKSLENHKSNSTADEKTGPSPRTPDSFVTVTKSITGSMDNSKNPPQDNKNFQSTYYTKSSTCGYFTFSCNIVYGANGRSKICRPKAPTNGKC